AGIADSDRPHLILVTIDTLRRDVLSAVSPDAPPTPGLDAIAAEGILYTNYWSSSCWTLPAMATLMTGRAPRELGVAKYAGVPTGVRTLSQLASEAGYSTAAFTANPYLMPAYGFDRGFGEFEHALVLEPLLPAARSVLARELSYLADTRLDLDDAAVIVGKAARWLKQRRDDAPLFLWLHLMDPHLPYRWHSLPANAPAAAPGRGVQPARTEIPDDPLFTDGVFPAAHLPGVRDSLPGVSAEVRAGLWALYRREVQYTDACLSKLWATLRELGIWDSALVIVTSDHGEEFFEHGGFEHGHSLMPEVTGVPLLIRQPGARDGGSTCAADHDALDLVPSVCRFLSWTPPAGLEGADDLLYVDTDAARQGKAEGDAPAIMENMLYGEPQLACRAWPYLGVVGEGGVGSAWYDLGADPGARHPLADDPAAAAAILTAAHARLSAWDARSALMSAAGVDSVGLSADLRRQLQSLGY
ncbi:sulfatase, partial [bacterium]|nr:sulfatase [bacterium]